MVRKIFMTSISALALIGLSACGDSADTQNQTKAQSPDADAAQPKPAANGQKSEAQVKQELKVFKDSVEKAMNDIPPELREKFQTAFACEIDRNSKLPAPKEIDASTIREITARLKAGASATC